MTGTERKKIKKMKVNAKKLALVFPPPTYLSLCRARYSIAESEIASPRGVDREEFVTAYAAFLQADKKSEFLNLVGSYSRQSGLPPAIVSQESMIVPVQSGGRIVCVIVVDRKIRVGWTYPPSEISDADGGYVKTILSALDPEAADLADHLP